MSEKLKFNGERSENSAYANYEALSQNRQSLRDIGRRALGLFRRTPPEDDSSASRRAYYEKSFAEILNTDEDYDFSDQDSLNVITDIESQSLTDHRFDRTQDIHFTMTQAINRQIPLIEVVNDLALKASLGDAPRKESDERRYAAKRDIIDTAFRERALNNTGSMFIKQEVLPVIDQAKPQSISGKTILIKSALKNFDGSPEAQVRFQAIASEILPIIDNNDENRFQVQVLGSVIEHSDNSDTIHETLEFARRTLLPIIEAEDNMNKTVFCEFADRVIAEPESRDFYEHTVLPKLQNGDESLGFLANTNFLRNERRIKNYNLDCLTTKISPRSLNQLLQERRQLTTTEVSKLEQNRIDALAIERTVIDDHSFIHHELPETHNLISAMVNYYDAKDTPQFAIAKENLQSVVDRCQAPDGSNGASYGDLSGHVFALENYDTIIDGEVRDDYTSRKYHEPAIDILRRLKENTSTEISSPPETDDEKLNHLLHKINPHRSLETGEVILDWNEVGDLVSYMNQSLISRQGEYGFLPNDVEAIAYTERMAAYAIQNISENQRQELPFDATFREIIKFNRLTASYDSYNASEFERFWNWFSDTSLEPSKTQEHYVRLQLDVVAQLGKLAKYYKQIDKPELASSLQSGGLASEIISLTDPRPAKTLREIADRRAPQFQCLTNPITKT